MSARKFEGVGWWAAYSAAVVVAAVVVIGPSNLALRGGYMAWQPPISAAIEPGDHIQTSYFLWLWEDALRGGGHGPWSDPYQFGATGHTPHQPFGWPLVLVSVPVSLVLGPVAAYNALVMLAFVAAALATAAWCRALRLSRWSAGVAGFAFAFAPFRLVQATSHVNALLAFLFPLMLLCLERALQPEGRQRLWGWAAAATGVSIVASGELHLALFAALLAPAYLLMRLPLVRRSWRPLLAPGLSAVVLAGAVAWAQQNWILGPSVAAGGRSIDEAAENAPRVANLFTRGGPLTWPGFERYAYLGFAVLALAIVGALVTARRRPALVAGLAATTAGALAMAVVPGLVGHPQIQRAYRWVPYLAYSRVPGRSLVLATLALAALAAFAVEALRPRWRSLAAALAGVAIVVQAPTGLFAVNAADERVAPGVAAGDTVLDLPAFGPGHFSGAAYELGIMSRPGPRVGGYSPFVTPAAEAAQKATDALSVPSPDPCVWKRLLTRFRVDHVVVHRSLYGEGPLRWPGDVEAVLDGLESIPGLIRTAESGDLVSFRVIPERLRCGPVAGP